ncbi:Uncharacterized protein Adt_37875 [Abeliophyllum distichum]|uniref:Uncharacterized protein n=1 Tax=Abeliophyllum distichum TaxID=126358 RepID=A0ABD1Q1J4_9LAMI
MTEKVRLIVSHDRNFTNYGEEWKWGGKRTMSIKVASDIAYDELVYRLMEKLNVDDNRFTCHLKFILLAMNLPPAQLNEDDDLQWYISIYKETTLCDVVDQRGIPTV